MLCRYFNTSQLQTRQSNFELQKDNVTNLMFNEQLVGDTIHDSEKGFAQNGCH